MNLPDGLKPSSFTLTASIFPAIRACEAARVFTGPRGDMAPAAWWGIFVHRFIQYAKTKDEEYAIDYIERKFKRASRCCSSIDLGAIPDGSHEVQITYSVDTRTAVRGKTQTNALEHVTGRADLTYDVNFAGYENGVVDWKTGKSTDHDASEHEQLLVIATGLWLEAGPDHEDEPIHGSLVGVRSNGDLDWYSAVYEPDQLDAFYKMTRHLVLLVDETRADFRAGTMPDFTPGPHCRDCFAALACPVATQEARDWKNGISPKKKKGV